VRSLRHVINFARRRNSVFRNHANGNLSSVGAAYQYIAPTELGESFGFLSRGSAALHPWLQIFRPAGAGESFGFLSRGSAPLHPWAASTSCLRHSMGILAP